MITCQGVDVTSIAQSVERRAFNLKAEGSIPSGGILPLNTVVGISKLVKELLLRSNTKVRGFKSHSLHTLY